MTFDELQQTLYENAVARFGKTRAEELKPSIEETAADLLKLHNHSLNFQDEP